jgi:hypothetical protein
MAETMPEIKCNRSPAVSVYCESEVMWTLNLLLKAELKKRSFTVNTTRDNPDADMEVSQWGKLAKGHDLFLSLHSNAASRWGIDERTDYPSLSCRLLTQRTNWGNGLQPQSRSY